MIINGRINREFYGDITEEQMPPHPTHCNCGRPLVKHIEQDGYTPMGDQAQILTWCCPKTLGRWNRGSLIFMAHDEYEADHFVDWHWRKRYYR